MNDRGQAYTLEAVAAAIVLLGSLLYALQMAAVTPLTASTSSQHIEHQQRQSAQGLLDTAVANESLRTAVLHWNETEGEFYQSIEEGYYATGGPPGTTFGAMINRTFTDRGFAVNVNIVYPTPEGDFRRERMINLGVPSDNAVSARRTMTLYDSDRLTGPTSTTLGNTTTYLVRDSAPDSIVYTVIRVEVIVWRM